jgi:hypothetical protein
MSWETMLIISLAPPLKTGQWHRVSYAAQRDRNRKTVKIDSRNLIKKVRRLTRAYECSRRSG